MQLSDRRMTAAELEAIRQESLPRLQKFMAEQNRIWASLTLPMYYACYQLTMNKALGESIP